MKDQKKACWKKRKDFHLIAKNWHIDDHDIEAVGYKYTSLMSFCRVLACRIRHATGDSFAGDYYDDVIPFYV